MKVSLNWVKKYVDLPKNITNKELAYDLTMRTVEVESVTNTSEKFHDIVVGQILEAKKHPKADKLLVFKVDLGNEVRQIVSGIAKFYKPEDLIGYKVIVVKNLVNIIVG